MDFCAGAGTFTLADGKTYVGEFKDNNFNGQGEARVGGRLHKVGRRGRMVWQGCSCCPLGEMVGGLTPSWALLQWAVPVAGGSARSGCGCSLKLVLLTPPIETSHLIPPPCFAHSSSPSTTIHPAVGQVVREKSVHTVS